MKRDWILDPNLVLYLPLYKHDGTTFISDDAYGHLCTVTGATWGVQGRTFDGVDDRITVPDHASLDATTALTIIAWAYHDANANEFMVSKWGATDNSYSLLQGGTPFKGIFEIQVSNASKQVLSDTVLPATTWFMLAGVYNKTDLRIYLNGVLDCTPVAQTSNIDVTAEDVYVGWGLSNTYAWAGKIGEAVISSRAFTASEIQRIYLATKKRYL